MARVLGFAVALGCAAMLVYAIAPAAPAKRSRSTPARSTSAGAAHRARHKATAKSTASATMDRSTAEHLATPPDAATTPAYRYGRLSQADCEAELASRHVDFIRETATAVEEPVRLTGPVRGVVFRIDGKDRARRTSPYEIVDCRLVLALDDFAEILRRHDIVEVRHYSMYRPPRKWPDGALGKRHDGALAIDTGRFIDSSGATLDVDKDFHGAIDAETCGDGAAPRPATEAALALRGILCEAVERRLFNVVLTPNYNRAHKNHFHLELTTGVRWFLVH